jgi:hypothetical protein
VATGGAYRTYDEVGDYGSLAVGPDGTFYPVWIDNRTGKPQVYLAAVTVRAPVMRPAAVDALIGRNVTDSVVLITTKSSFDAKKCSMELAFDLVNRSGAPLRAPLLVRPNRLLSQIGTPVATGTLQDAAGRALWRFGRVGRVAPDSVVSGVARVQLTDCMSLYSSTRRQQRTDSRLVGTPVFGLAGPKMLVIEASIFEPRE